MKRITLVLCSAAILFAACNSKKDEKTAETKEATGGTKMEEPKAWIPIDSNMMNKAWQENMKIGEPHKMMAKGAGTWDAEVTMWMAAGAPPSVSKATTVVTSLYGGLYQEAKHTGNMMGMPFEGMSTMGYDNLKKEYVSTWIDNMGSGIMMMTGQYDDASKKLSMSGTTKCMNGQDATMREVFTMTDDDHQILEMFGPDPQTGKEYKNMEIKYTRKK